MSESRVIRFPSKVVGIPSLHAREEQCSLFGTAPDGRGKVAFIDVERLAEEPLLRLLALNGVTALVDLRPCPVFERPKFRHKNVVFYMHDRDIRYIEFALIVKWPSQGSAMAAMQARDAYAKIEPMLERGLSICLYDKSSKELGFLDEMRRMLRHSRTYLTELHPRSLAGMPA